MIIKYSREFSIADRQIGYNHPTFIIAEAGVAHFGSIDKAKRLIDMAVEAGADSVKFQIFKTDELISAESNEWRNRMKSRELPFEAFRDLKIYCREKNIIFLATAHDELSLEFLHTLNVPAYKIGSGEVRNWPFIENVASHKKPVILSTGMYTLDDIGSALHVIKKTGNPDIAVLHCVTSYPTSPGDVNLNTMNTIREAYDVIVGYSDHTEGFHFPLAAVALGACLIEKHISLDFNVPNAQDWKVSCDHHNLSSMVRQIRDIEAGRGTGKKILGKAESENLNWARKSIVAADHIQENEVITNEKICFKRPGYGITPSELNLVVGKRAKHKINKDTIIKRENLI